MSDQYAPQCADRKCDLVWANVHGQTVYWVCIICILLLAAHVVLNARRRSIKLKRGKREWDE